MKLKTDPTTKTVSFELPGSFYSAEAVQIAAHVFSSRADVYASDQRGTRSVSLQAKRASADKPCLEALAGEFVNELLNQEYRFVVGRFNRNISSFIVTQALYCASGADQPQAAASGEETPEFKAAVAELMRQAQDEIQRTMPRKIAPQGTPLPPAREDAGV